MALLVFLVAFVGCTNAKSSENAEFTIKVSGSEGVEFEGFCTHEVKYNSGSRTEETDIQGKMTAEKNTYEFIIPGIEISCKITNKTPGKPITILLLKDGIEVKRVEGTENDFYLSYYPRLTVDTSEKAALGIRYVPSEHVGTVNEIVEFTEAEKAKIADLIETLPPEVRQQYAVEYEAWQDTWDTPEFQLRSNSRAYTQSEQYKQLLIYCQEQDTAVWPLIFEKLNTDRVYIVAVLIEDLTLDKHSSIMNTVRGESQSERYIETGDYIAPSAEANVMKYVKELLALL
jgi:hypothetical protein